MVWRLTFAVVLLTLTLGCDRHNSRIGPSPLVSSGGLSGGLLSGGLSILIISGGSALTTTVFPATPVTLPRGSTVTCLNSDNTHQPGRIAGTVNSGVFTPGESSSVALINAGTFTLGCPLQPSIIVTIIVV
jgi:hypothetical protein